MIAGIIRFFIGLLLLPLCVGVTQAVISLVLSLPTGNEMIPTPLLAFGGGFLLWQIMFILLPRPVRAYVLAHELTHAFWGMMMGAKVSRMRISKESGSVTLSKVNVWITLAPYFFPLYTFIVIAVFYIVGIFYPVERYYLLWLALVGLTWGFHISFTLTALLQAQTDIRSYGHLFSYTIIYLCNVAGLALWIVLVSDATFVQMGHFLGQDILAVFRKLIEWAQIAYTRYNKPGAAIVFFTGAG